MSSGKTLAQIGHAALMADLDPDLELDVVGSTAAEWGRLVARRVAVVRDGGLTELAPGSETVLVLEGAHDERASRGCARVASPDRQSIRQRRQRAQARRRPGSAPQRHRDRAHPGARRCHRHRRRVVAARRGDLRVLGGRHLQRGDQRASRRRPGRVRTGGRHERASACARSSRDPTRAAARIAQGTPRRISLGRINGRMFAFNAGIGFDAELVRRVDAKGRRADGKRPGDIAFTWTVVKALVDHRFRYATALEVEGLGRAAFALIANCSPYT